MDVEMKAYSLEEINRLECRDVPVPEPNEDEVLVRVRAAGICGSDIPRIFETGTYHFPTIPGHEFAGEVVSKEECGALSGAAGRRVGVFPLIPCMECEACKRKQYEMCRSYNYLGSRCDGGFAEYVKVPRWNLIDLPEAVSFEKAAMLEPASVALHAVRRLRLDEVHSVALLGLGTIGIMIAEWLHIFGVEQLFATCHSAEHGKLMQRVACERYMFWDTSFACAEDTTAEGSVRSVDQQVGAADKILAWSDRRGVDAVIDCVGSSESLSDAITCVRPGGQILVVGNPKGDISLDKNTYWKILRKQITLNGTWNSSFTHEEDDDWHTVLRACADGSLNLRDLITHRLPFDQLEQGLRIMRDRTEFRNKVMIVM